MSHEQRRPIRDPAPPSYPLSSIEIRESDRDVREQPIDKLFLVVNTDVPAKIPAEVLSRHDSREAAQAWIDRKTAEGRLG